MKITLNGLTIGYDDQGSGTPLMFLHAFPLNRSMWGDQVTALAHRFRVITMDLRGHGESDALLWHFSLEQYADDVAALINQLSIDRAVLIGLSMGGYIAFAFYRKYPDRVRALVLADTRAAADTVESRAGRVALAQTAFRHGAGAVADLMLPKLLGATSLERRADLAAKVRHIISGNDICGMIVDSMAMADRPDSRSLLPTITVPTMVLVGEEDHTTPLTEAQAMAAGIPGTKLVVIPGAGHLSNLEQPEAFNEALHRFLEELGE